MTMHNTEKVWTHTYMFPEKCSTVPGDVGNFLHTVVMITHTVIKNARHDEGQIEGKKKKKREWMRMVSKHMKWRQTTIKLHGNTEGPFQLISENSELSWSQPILLQISL